MREGPTRHFARNYSGVLQPLQEMKFIPKKRWITLQEEFLSQIFQLHPEITMDRSDPSQTNYSSSEILYTRPFIYIVINVFANLHENCI